MCTALSTLSSRQGTALSTLSFLQPVRLTSNLASRKKSKQKWGGITRDPYKTFQKRADHKRMYEQMKIPLKSEERSLREMDYPINFDSLGAFYISGWVYVKLQPKKRGWLAVWYHHYQHSDPYNCFLFASL